MPLADASDAIFLGEGGTPLLHLRKLGAMLWLRRLFIKDEGVNPTGTFKARGIAAAIAKACELGATGFTLPSAGNAAGAALAYCARGGMKF